MRSYNITITYSDGKITFYQDNFENRDEAFEFCDTFRLLNESVIDIHFEDTSALFDLESMDEEND